MDCGVTLTGPGFSEINFGGDEGARTPDLGIANAALSQLSYIPTIESYKSYTRSASAGQFKKGLFYH